MYLIKPPQKKQKMVFTVTFQFLAFQLCNMFACIVEDMQIISYHIFLSCQQNMVQTILFIMDKTLPESRVNSLCTSIFVRITAVLGDIFTEVLTQCQISSFWAVVKC